MNFKLQSVKKEVKPLKIMMYGPTYSGKTLGALKLANGIVQEIRKCTPEEAWKHILLVDTEYGRGALYAGEGAYYYHKIEEPYTLSKLNEVFTIIKAEDDIDVVIIDSYTHFWSKSGGILHQKLLRDQAGGNSYTNWNGLTQEFNDSLDEILKSKKHVITTLRAKSDVALVENDKGKMAPKAFGLKPESRDGIDFEFDIVINVDKETHNIILDKGIPGLASTYEMITEDTGKLFYTTSIDNAVKVERTKEDIINDIRSMAKMGQTYINFMMLELSGRKIETLELSELVTLETKLKNQIKLNQKK